MRNIHFSVQTGKTFRMVVETGTNKSGWGKWAHPVRLSVVEVDVSDFQSWLNASTWVTGNGVRLIEACSVDSRSVGPRSNYGRTLAAMIANTAKIGPEIFTDLDGAAAWVKTSADAQILRDAAQGGASVAATAERRM